MPRIYKTKTNRSETITNEKLNRAARMVRDNYRSIRSASEACGKNRMTLKRFLEKGQKGYDLTRSTHRVFSSEDEESLANHIKALDSCFHGLDREKYRILAFDYAKANNIKTPPNWTKNGMAGKIN